MKFEQYKFLKNNLLDNVVDEKNIAQGKPSPLVLAYLGDTVYSLYVRERLVKIENNKVRVLNDVSAVMVSAVMQSKALDFVAELFTPEESNIVRRGRNTKASVPKSASVNEYRKSTGFECLLGWLYHNGATDRLYEIMNKAFVFSINQLKSGELK